LIPPSEAGVIEAYISSQSDGFFAQTKGYFTASANANDTFKHDGKLKEKFHA